MKSLNRRFFAAALCGTVAGGLQIAGVDWWLCVLVLVPFCALVLGERDGRKAKRLVICFLLPDLLAQTAFLVTVYDILPVPVFWGYVLAPAAALLAGIWLTALQALPLMAFPSLRQNLFADCLIFAFLWATGEWLSEVVPVLPLPWARLGNTAAGSRYFLQGASLLGVYYLSFCMVLAAAFLAVALLHWHQNSRQARGLLLAAAVVLGGNILYGVVKANTFTDSGVSISAAVVQGSVEGAEKWDTDTKTAFASYYPMLEQLKGTGVQLVLLPETALPRLEKEPELYAQLAQFAKANEMLIVTGAFSYAGEDTYNALRVVGNSTAVDPYRKQKLVIFGEYYPFATLFHQSSLTQGTKNPVLSTDLGNFAGVICIESAYSGLVREQAAQSQAIFVSTNDSWFKKSYARQFHYRMSVLRAVENNQWLLRAGNCGISAVIDPLGREVTVLSGKEEGILRAQIVLRQEKSLYTKAGNLIVIPGVVFALAAVFIKILRSVRWIR